MADICCGPVNTVTDRCPWCRRDSKTDSRGRCTNEWDRPRRAVHPQFTTVPMRIMDCACWNCGARTRMNQLQNPKEFEALLRRREVLEATCSRCGAGLDVSQSLIQVVRG